MARKKTLLWATLIGAALGVRVARSGLPLPAGIPALAVDKVLCAQWQLPGAVALWVVYSLYWEAAARGASSDKAAESHASRGAHVFLVNAALILEVAPLRGLGRYLPMSSAVMTAGLALATAGLAFAIWARRHLGANWSGRITIKVDHQLVRSGPYRLLRHPIYTGILTMFAGTAVVTGTWLAAGGFAVAAIAYWRKLRLEEARLTAAFGSEYQAYRGETWALVPGLF